MKLVWRLLAVWGIADSIWLASSPQAWSGFWRRGIDTISNRKENARVFAFFQLGICLWLLKALSNKK